MKHLKGINQKAARIEAYVAYQAAEARAAELDVVGLESPKPPHAQSARAGVTTKLTFSTVSRPMPTCITARGCAAGRTRVWRSTERWQKRTPSSWSVSMHRRAIGKGGDE